MRRSLWSALHDGSLERIVIADGATTLTFDVPHVRHEAKLGSDARFVLSARGSVSLAALAWIDPMTPRPPSSDPAEAAAWSKLGTMRSLDWDAFAAAIERSVAEADGGMAIVQAEIMQPAEGPSSLVLRGDLAPQWYWVEVRVEATRISFARETGEELEVEPIVALGEAYWEAWGAERRGGGDRQRH